MNGDNNMGEDMPSAKEIERETMDEMKPEQMKMDSEPMREPMKEEVKKNIRQKGKFGWLTWIIIIIIIIIIVLLFI